ncbi:MAG: helix-turn-helix transcriptional regulator [Clostridia bacterium]|nr:helix-turn-helix transcriptional regulator [Clostridia bacterium]
MKIRFGEILKDLRRKNDITKEELADILGVTSQSVSRWEKGACYPDMELLPAIANYFNVTVDDLLGMKEIRSRERLNAIFTEGLNLERESKYEDAVGVFRAALKNFPDNIALTSELALALSKCESVNNKKEAIALSEKVLARCTNEKIRSTVRANLCYLYRDCGFNDKAEETARTLPHIWECREIHLREFVADNKDLSERHLNIIMQVLDDYVNQRPISFSLGYKPEESINVKLLKEIFS